MSDVFERVLESARNAPSNPEAEKALEILAEKGRNMTGAERLEQKRYNLYGTPDPDPETKARIDKYMKDYYNV